MSADRWTDELLDRMRGLGDPEAEEALSLVMSSVPDPRVALRRIFADMDSNDDKAVHEDFPDLSGFFDRTRSLPPATDLERIRRGEDVFNRHAFDGGLCLLGKSLPEGYQAPNLSIVLNISGNLSRYTYRRLLSTLQTVVNVSCMSGFQDEGRAIITAQKLRLLHAGVRRIAAMHPELTARQKPSDASPVAFTERYGVPANQEDMLGTILGFSLLVIEGWRILGAGVTRPEEEDYLYLWLCFARMMGIHPAGKPDSMEFLPTDVDDASAFYQRYRERHYVGQDDNPDGVTLARANLSMLEELARREMLPGLYRWGGWMIPRLMLQQLLGWQQCRNLGLPTTPGHRLLLWIFRGLHTIADRVEVPVTKDGDRVGLLLFQHLINCGEGSQVTFTVPTDLEDLKRMAFEPGLASDSSIPRPRAGATGGA